VIALLLVLVAIIVIAWLHHENDRITKENFDRIADGMTQAEVEAILGPPTAAEIYHNNNFGRMVTWESRQIQDHLVYLRIINISFDPNGRKRGTGQYSNFQVDIDSWLRFQDWVAKWSPWLAKTLPLILIR
jgi:hypothetical protein